MTLPYTGGSLENLLRAALYRPDQAPRLLKRGGDVKDHLRRVEEVANTLKLDAAAKCAYLINSLEEPIQFEMYSHLEYTAHNQDFDWLKKKLGDMLGEQASNVIHS